jgi:hypothetical protein
MAQAFDFPQLPLIQFNKFPNGLSTQVGSGAIRDFRGKRV